MTKNNVVVIEQWVRDGNLGKLLLVHPETGEQKIADLTPQQRAIVKRYISLKDDEKKLTQQLAEAKTALLDLVPHGAATFKNGTSVTVTKVSAFNKAEFMTAGLGELDRRGLTEEALKLDVDTEVLRTRARDLYDEYSKPRSVRVNVAKKG